MSEQKVNIRLVASERMSAAKGHKEHEYVRLPRRTRAKVGDRARLRLVIKKHEAVLEVKPAYKEDLDILKAQVKAGDISKEEEAKTGFVTADRYRALVGRYKNIDDCYLSDSVDDIKVGADPEFALVDPHSTRFQYAGYIGGFPKAGSLGSDGPAAEVRPAPFSEVAKVVGDMKRIFEQGNRAIEAYRWVAGATYSSPKYPQDRTIHLGFHIHLGDPALIRHNQRNAIYERIIRVLDDTIAIPLVRIDGPKAAERRNKTYQGYGRYGRWGDQRPQANRFEWRVPSGLWLAHPDLSMILLSVAKAMTEACYQKMAEHDFDPEWINAPANRNGFLKFWGLLPKRVAQQTLNASLSEKVTDGMIYKALTRLTELDNASKYKAEIEEFGRLVTLKKPKFNLDIKETWLAGKSMFLGSKAKRRA
jgi:hypothetical protein